MKFKIYVDPRSGIPHVEVSTNRSGPPRSPFVHLYKQVGVIELRKNECSDLLSQLLRFEPWNAPIMAQTLEDIVYRAVVMGFLNSRRFKKFRVEERERKRKRKREGKTPSPR